MHVQLALLQRVAGNQAVAGLVAPRPTATVQRRTVTDANHDYKVLRAVPGTSYELVRRDYRPGSSRFLFDTRTTTRLKDTPLTSDEGNELVAVFQDLLTQGVGSLDKMVEQIDHARELTIPVGVTLARLRLIHQNIRDVVRLRIAADHAQIRAMLNNTISLGFNIAFRSIEIPGSDPHKGGQVVVFVNYNRTGGGTERVVYKPGDLAIDRLLYGDQPGSVADQLGGSMARYTIDARHDAAAPDERKRHYGYMQFVAAQGPQNAADVRAVYKSLGENLAVAYVFGLRDIHHENFLLLQDRLLFIDMEAATGTYTGFGAMELGGLPNVLATKIAKSLVGVAGATLTWMPSDADLRQEVEDGFVAKMAVLNTGANVGASVATFSTMSARFVPFTTADLQRLAGRFLGKLGAQPKRADLDAFTRQTQDLATTTALASTQPNPPPAGLEADLLTLLRHQTTKHALNAGDVPFWTRQGNDVRAEDGTVLVNNMPHPRIKSAASIATDANARRGDTAQALTNFRQSVPNMLGAPSTRILAEHPFQRALNGLPP